MIAPATGKAFAVLFQDLTRWDPPSFHKIEWNWPAKVMKPIGSFLKPRKEKVDPKASPFIDLQPITIHFDGSIDKREVAQGRSYTMDLFFARPGDIAVAKIDLKNGAVAIVPDWPNVVVTNHFAVYEPDRGLIVPEYFHLLIQTNFFRSHLWRNKVGAEGRKEVKLDFFESELIPVPCLETQRAILDSWQDAQTAVANSRAQASATEERLQETLLDDLGLLLPEQKVASRAFAVDWNALSRWGVGVTRETLNRPTFDGAKYPLACLGDVIADLENGWSPKCENRPAKADEWGVLKLGAVSFGVFNPKENKALPKGLAPRPACELKPGDLLISRANITRLVGACALVEAARPRLMLCDKIFRAVWRDDATVDKRFLVEVLKIPHVRWQIEHNVTGASPTMKNITKPNLLALRFPLPPIEKQTDIARKLQALREEGYRLAADAKRMEAQIRAEIEAMILGTKPVPKTGRKR